MKHKLLFLALFLLATGGSLRAQGLSYTAGPFTNSGWLYVCPVPSGGTPCPSPSTIYSNVTLTTQISNPIQVSAGNTVTFFIAAGQYTIQFPASGYSTVVNLGSSSGGAANSPTPQATVGPGFNVKNYGAKGDAQATGSSACTFIGGNAPFSCTGTAFSSATDVGKNLFCNSTNGGASFFGNSLQTIASVQSATAVTASTTSGFSAPGGCVWGTIDDTAITAAVTAAKAASKSVQGTGNTGIFAATPRLYFPAGGYLVCADLLLGMVTLSSTTDGFIIEGDGVDQTFLYAGGGGACPLTNNSALGSFIQIPSGAANIHIRNLTIDGVNNTSANISSAVSMAGSAHVSDVLIQRWGGNSGAAFNCAGGSIQAERLVTIGNQGIGQQFSQCGGEVRAGGSSNNANSANIVVQNISESNQAGLLEIFGMLVDECGTNSIGCFQVINSTGLRLFGSKIFGTPNGFCINIDGTSFVHWAGGLCGVFGTDTNTGGPKIAAGGVLEASDLRMISTGTAKSVTNSGTFLDNGNNTSESMFQIASGTSTGTTAVLTLTTAGANVNATCSSGDALMVENAGIPGYNGYFAAGSGITAVTATTLTYTTTGSNLGALGAGGTAHCRNLQTYSGNLPKALLNNPIPNTCYITGTFAATTSALPMCNFRGQSATNISRILAASTTSTTCSVAPIVTISDGTVSWTLTLTTGKSQWDSSVDASTGVGTTISKPNSTITVSNTAGTCTTPPTNFSVSYNISPILSN